MSLLNKSIVPPLRLTFIMWAVFVFEYYTSFELAFLGVRPRTLNGLIGIFTMPLIHGDFGHIASNTIPLIVLGSTLYLFYDKIAPKVFLQCYFLTGILIWIVGRDYYHIGASGLIYGIASFLIFFGFFRKDFKSIIISIVIIIFYGGMVYGLLPIDSKVSFEGHLMGAVAGLIAAFTLRNKK
ncbi:MAG: rhomboid family intramembrane serine protease [Bacteroidota bacterium]